MPSLHPPTLRRARTVAALSLLPLVGACNMVVLNPAGDIAKQQANLVVVSTLLMLVIIIPVIALTLIFAWRYRQTNTEARYEPEWAHSTGLELIIWSAPLLIIIALGAITWISTHTLDPYRPVGRISADKALAAGAKPLEIDVVALDWKWLFIYPEQGIATVNAVVLPVDRQVRFRITSSSVMNSFYIPALAGQIYAMPGMETKLHAVLNRAGKFEGFSANYSGAGFSDMRFTAQGVAPARFDSWVTDMRAKGGTLNGAQYLALEKPSEKAPVMRFSTVTPDLFEKIVQMCVRPGQPCMADTMRMDMMKRGKGGAMPHEAPINNSAKPLPGTPKGALLKNPGEKGSSPHIFAPSGPNAPGNQAPGTDANRNMTRNQPLPLPGQPVAARG